MKNILFVGSLAVKSGRLDGVTIKCKCLLDYLLEKHGNLKIIDVDNYKKRWPIIIYQFFIHYFKSNDIIICSSSPGASVILHFLYKIKSKKKIFYFVCGGSIDEKILSNVYKIEWYKNLNGVYVESDILVNNLKSLGINNVKKINNFRNPKFCVDIKQLNNKSNQIKFVFFGRVVKSKGVEYAIDLMKKLNDDGYEVILDIYGQISDEYRIIIDKKIENVSFIKYKGPIVPNGVTEYKILSEYDVFILPTQHPGEGLPGALIDAYISGLAVVVSNWKYAKEYVDNYKNGVIFEYRDYNDMYIKVKEMINKNKILEYKKNSLKKSIEYNINFILKDIDKEF